MIKLPDYSKAFEYENSFYLSSTPGRIVKMLAHYELYKMTADIPGAIIECGVFKGVSLIRFTTFRNLFKKTYLKKIIAFDTFEKFPKTKFGQDKKPRQKFITDAGAESISKKQMIDVLKHKHIYENIDLIKGDITKTVPQYLKTYPNLKISLLNLDTDIYEPAVVILNYLFPKILKGGILILDDYGIFPGETKAVNDYFKNKSVSINKLPFVKTPSYIIKQ